MSFPAISAFLASRMEPGRAFALQSAILVTFLAAASVPTPIYALYREHWGFSAVMLTVIFGVYALSLLAALLTTDALSDYVGRRSVILAALALQIVAILLFLVANGVATLMAWSARQSMMTGALCLMAGLGVTLLGANLQGIGTFFIGTAIAGFGFGAGLAGARRAVAPLAAPEERSGLMAAFFVIGYLALSVPAIIAGVLTQRLDLVAATYWFGGALILLAAAAAVATLFCHPPHRGRDALHG